MSALSQVLQHTENSIALHGGLVEVKDASKLRSSIGKLVEVSATGAAEQAGWARYMIRQAALALGIGSLLLAMLEKEQVTQLWVAVGFLALGIAWIPPSYLAALAPRDSGAHGGGARVQGAGARMGRVGSVHTIGYALGGAFAAISLQWGGRSGAMTLLLVLAGVFALGAVFLTRVLRSENEGADANPAQVQGHTQAPTQAQEVSS